MMKMRLLIVLIIAMVATFNLGNVNAKKTTPSEEQPVAQQVMLLSEVSIEKAREHKDAIKDGAIAAALKVPSDHVQIIDIKKFSDDETELVYNVKAASTAGQNALCRKMTTNEYHDDLQNKISAATGISKDAMTVSLRACEHEKILVEEGTSIKELEQKNETADEVPVNIHNGDGVDTVETPKEVKANNKQVDESTITLAECPKGSTGKVCSGNGKCAILNIGTEDPTKTLIEKVCYCKPGYYGEGCDKLRCNSNGGKSITGDVPCGKHGVCKKDRNGRYPRCFCDKGWGGAGCEEPVCPGSKNDCNRRGICADLDGKKTCYCEPNYYGESCEFEYLDLPPPTPLHNVTRDPRIPLFNPPRVNASCRAVEVSETGVRQESSTCFGHGICELSKDGEPRCKCDASYGGQLCTVRTCAAGCDANGGTCDPRTGKCSNCPQKRYGEHACEHVYCGNGGSDHLANMCYNNGKCNNATGICTCFLDGKPDSNLCKNKPMTTFDESTDPDVVTKYTPPPEKVAGFNAKPKPVDGSITSTSVTLSATPVNAVDIKCGVFEYNALKPTASEVYAGNGISGHTVGQKNGPVVPVVTGVSEGAGAAINNMVVTGLNPNTPYDVYCATNDPVKELSEMALFTTAGSASAPNVGIGGFTEQLTVEKVTPTSVTFVVTPATATSIVCGVFNQGAIPPTADELYKKTGNNGAATGEQNGPVVAAHTCTNSGPGTPIPSEEINNLTPNKAYNLYCATNDKVKVLSDKIVFNTGAASQDTDKTVTKDGAEAIEEKEKAARAEEAMKAAQRAEEAAKAANKKALDEKQKHEEAAKAAEEATKVATAKDEEAQKNKDVKTKGEEALKAEEQKQIEDQKENEASTRAEEAAKKAKKAEEASKAATKEAKTATEEAKEETQKEEKEDKGAEGNDILGTTCIPELCSFGKCDGNKCVCDPGFKGKKCDIRWCGHSDCGWSNQQGECLYDESGELREGHCKCFGGWTGKFCQDKVPESDGSACDRDCGGGCLNEFQGSCKVQTKYFTDKGILHGNTDEVPTLQQLNINTDWTLINKYRKLSNKTANKKSTFAPEDAGITNARTCFLNCVTNCLASCQKELELKSEVARNETKKSYLVDKILQMDGHISKDLLKDAVNQQRAEAKDTVLLITNKMVMEANRVLASQAEQERELDEKSETVGGKSNATNAISFKSVDEKIVNLDAQKKHVHNKKKASTSGILGWIGSLYNKFRGKK